MATITGFYSERAVVDIPCISLIIIDELIRALDCVELSIKPRKCRMLILCLY